jgi:Calcineurin-like phosphoesterase
MSSQPYPYPHVLRRARCACVLALLAVFAASPALVAQEPEDLPVAILAPAKKLPPVADTAGITRFSFIAYGDTRGRHDGKELQSEHKLVIEAMLRKIKTMRRGPDPVRFVLQSGDAVANGLVARQWTVSFVPLINRLTQEGGVSYFFAAGNHDVGHVHDKANPKYGVGLRNLLAANASLMPREGTPHRLAGYPTYGFGYGNTWFLAFDSDIAADEQQFAWVKKELAGLDRTRFPNVVLFYHHPAFSSGPHGGGASVEVPQQELRRRYHPLFRQYHVTLLLTGHEHLFEHWVERWTDATGRHRLDQVVSGGGGAPLYDYHGEPVLRDYFAAGRAEKVSLEHLVKPSVERGGNPFHFVVVHVDGTHLRLEVVGVDWGRGFKPYRSATTSLEDPERRGTGARRAARRPQRSKG